MSIFDRDFECYNLVIHDESNFIIDDKKKITSSNVEEGFIEYHSSYTDGVNHMRLVEFVSQVVNPKNDIEDINNFIFFDVEARHYNNNVLYRINITSYPFVEDFLPENDIMMFGRPLYIRIKLFEGENLFFDNNDNEVDCPHIIFFDNNLKLICIKYYSCIYILNEDDSFKMLLIKKDENNTEGVDDEKNLTKNDIEIINCIKLETQRLFNLYKINLVI